MTYFWETVESLKADKIKDVGFARFGNTHAMWLLVTLFVCIAVCVIYKQLNPRGRTHARRLVAALIVLDEIFKVVSLLSLDAFTAKYLPLQLCTINIFIIAIHSIKPTRTLDNFLYAICIPASIFPLMIPSWTELPLANFMHLHSFTVHILLLLYPLMLTVGGDIVPEVKYIPRSLALLLPMAVAAYIVNMNTKGTNFMFLKSPSDIPVLTIFRDLCGNHLVGFPFLIAAVLAVMYVPAAVVRRVKKK